jgi:WD40 repeat protein
VIVAPVVTASASARVVESLPCDRAEVQRARVKGLLDAGKLDRALRVIEAADRVCPSSAGASAAAKVTTLAQIGRDQEALSLAGKIEGDAGASAEAKAAAGAARALVTALGDRRPADGEALYREGLATLQAGAPAAAQRLFDRAIVAIERAARAAPGEERASLALDTPNGILGSIEDVAWARIGDRSYLAVAHDERVSVFDAETWQLRTRFAGKDRIASLAASPDGRTLVTGALDAIRLWDVESGKEIWRRDGTFNAAVYSHDGKSLLVADRYEPRLEIWDAATRVSRQEIVPKALPPKGGAVKKGSPPPDPQAVSIQSIALSTRGDLVAAGLNDGTARVWKSAGGKELRAFGGHTSNVLTVAFSGDGKLLVTADQDRVQLFQVGTGKLLQSFPMGYSGHVAFTADEKAIAISTVKGVIFWDVKTGKEQRRFDRIAPHTMAVEEKGTRFAASESHRVIVWDLASGAELQRLDRHASGLRSVAWVPGAASFVTGSWDETVRIWDAEKGTPKHTIKEEDSVNAVAVSPDGELIASGTTQAVTTLFKVSTGEKVESWTGTTGWVNALAFGQGGKTLAAGSEGGTLTLIDLPTHKVTHEIAGKHGAFNSVAWSPDGQLLAGGTQESSLHLYDGGSLQEIASSSMGNAVSSMMWSPDGSTLLTAENEGVLFDTRGGNLRKTRELSGHEGWVQAVAYRPDGRIIVTGASDRSLRVWDAATGTLLRTMTGHEGFIESVAFRPDGKQLVSASEDGTIRLWAVDEGNELLAIRPIEGSADAYAFTPGPNARIELFGNRGLSFPLCRLGTKSYRFELCRERFEVPGLSAKVIAGDSSYLDP